MFALQPDPQFEPDVTHTALPHEEAPGLQDEPEAAVLLPEEAAAAQFAEAVQFPLGHELPEVQPFAVQEAWEAQPEPEQD